MVELVSGRPSLHARGARLQGLCPFHDERTPSFSVDPAKKLYHCFGCGEGGDAIGFVQQTEALDFPDAVELLAERYNVRVERVEDDPKVEERRRRHDRLRTVLDRTARFYATYLWESAEARKAREYLAERGFSEEILREFRVGYSPSAWDRVTLSAQRDGFGPPELLAAGLAQQGRGGGVYDRFRGRIMFPLADSRGRVLGFGARSMGESRGPKYLNTSENELYHKGRQLFGIDLAGRTPPRPGAWWWWRATPTCWRCTRRACARRWRSWARRSPRSSWRCSPRRRRSCCWPSTPTAQARRPCCARRARPATAGWSCGWSRCPRAGTPPNCSLRAERTRLPSVCSGQYQYLSLRSAGYLPMQTSILLPAGIEHSRRRDR